MSRIKFDMRDMFSMCAFVAGAMCTLLPLNSLAEPVKSVSICDITQDYSQFLKKKILISAEYASDMEHSVILDRKCDELSYTFSISDSVKSTKFGRQFYNFAYDLKRPIGYKHANVVFVGKLLTFASEAHQPTNNMPPRPRYYIEAIKIISFEKLPAETSVLP